MASAVSPTADRKDRCRLINDRGVANWGRGLSQGGPHHLDTVKSFDFHQSVAAVKQHPKDPTVWGLQNTSSDVWVRVTPTGEAKEVAPGSSVSISTGTKIRFPASDGEFRAD